MTDLASLVARHGYTFVFGIIFAEAVGLPMPAALALIAGGAAAAAGTLNPAIVLAGALVALLSGDFILFILGRYTGWALLGALCRLSLNPETCILRSAESFYKRGRMTLLFSKFIPGVNTMAAPLAGSMKMPPLVFLRFDLVGAALYAFTYFAVGFLFRDFLAAIMRRFTEAGHAAEAAFLIAFVVYVTYRLVMYKKQRIYRVVPRIQVEDLARRLASEEKDKIVLVDVRSHGYYDSGAARIQGSIRLDPNNLEEHLNELARDKHIYLYCT